MDEKHMSLPLQTDSARRSPPPARRSVARHGFYLGGLLLSLWAFCYVGLGGFNSFGVMQPLAPAVEESPVTATGSRLVPLEAHIMSKCPDARDCLHDLVLPTMQRVFDKTNFTLSFIGRPTSDGGIECKHGPAECMGNIIELCASKLYPDPKIYLGFTMCLFREYQILPDQSVVEDCALEHGIDIEAINECATRDDGEYGLDLLRHSIQRTADAGVRYSCTVRLNEEEYCIRDNGQWKDCPAGAGVNDLVMAVQKLWQAANE